MAWYYVVDGSIAFPDAKGPGAWRAAVVPSWKGKGKVRVRDFLGWICKDTLVDDSDDVPPEFREALYLDVLDVLDAEATVTIRGYIHRDDADSIVALLEVAASLDAKGKVLLDHVLDRRSGIRVTLAKGQVDVRQGDVKMPKEVTDAVEKESAKRATAVVKAKKAAKTSAAPAKKAVPAKKPAAKKPAAKKKATKKG